MHVEEAPSRAQQMVYHAKQAMHTTSNEDDNGDFDIDPPLYQMMNTDILNNRSHDGYELNSDRWYFGAIRPSFK
jgi:hypothetical protein